MLRVLTAFLFASLLFAAPLRAEYYRATTPHFEIYAQGDVNDVRVRAERLERLDAALRRVSGINPEDYSRPLTIFFLNDVNDIQRILGRSYGAAAGFYSPRAGGSLAVAPGNTPWRGAGAMTPDTILFHEYAHHFLLQNFAAAYPPWFVEGFAEFYATAAFGEDGSVTVGNIPQFRVQGVRASSDISATDLLTTNAIDPRSRTIDQFYARSWLLVHLLTFSAERSGQRARYIAEIERGAPLDQAARTAFGDLRTLDAQLRLYVDSPIRSATVQAAVIPQPSIEIRALTPAEVALLPLRIEHMRGVPAARVADFLASARAVAAAHRDHPEIQFLLAEAEGLAGNAELSDRAADAVLAGVPNHSRALLRKARNVELRQGSAGHRAARALIARANRADQKDPLPLLAYYRSFRLAGEPVPVVALDGLLLAVQLAPQSADTRLVAGAALAKARHTDRAQSLLRPVAFAPHGGATSELAQELLRLIAASGGVELDAWAEAILRDRLT